MACAFKSGWELVIIPVSFPSLFPYYFSYSKRMVSAINTSAIFHITCTTIHSMVWSTFWDSWGNKTLKNTFLLPSINPFASFCQQLKSHLPSQNNNNNNEKDKKSTMPTKKPTFVRILQILSFSWLFSGENSQEWLEGWHRLSVPVPSPPDHSEYVTVLPKGGDIPQSEQDPSWGKRSWSLGNSRVFILSLIFYLFRWLRMWRNDRSSACCRSSSSTASRSPIRRSSSIDSRIFSKSRWGQLRQLGRFYGPVAKQCGCVIHQAAILDYIQHPAWKENVAACMVCIFRKKKFQPLPSSKDEAIARAFDRMSDNHTLMSVHFCFALIPLVFTK